MAPEQRRGIQIFTPPDAHVASVRLPVSEQHQLVELVLTARQSNDGIKPFQTINAAVLLPDHQGVQPILIEFERVWDPKTSELTNEVEMRVRMRSYPQGRGLIAQAADGFLHARYGPVLRIEEEDGTVRELDALGVANPYTRRGIDFTKWTDAELQAEHTLRFPLGSEEDPDSLLYALQNGRVTLAFEEYDLSEVEGTPL